MKRLNISIDDELHKQIKLCAVENNVTIAKFVMDAVIEKLKQAKEKKKKED